MPTPLRMKRINDRIKQVLSVLLITKIDDPRLAGVSVTDVKVDRELDFANIYVSSLDGAKSSREVIAGLNHARGYLKHEIAQEVDLRVMPRLRFFWDPTPEKADRIDTLLAKLHEEDEKLTDMEEFISDGDEDLYDEITSKDWESDDDLPELELDDEDVFFDEHDE
ncbi:MAG TPA: 30S ribosome-binding factor RbfA [Anaerolineaceae bacterium]|nr:30S ribosome-binding factor RbfA [Anaerolineaceae bacterium]HPR35160.1 30S ribosome-binding factor RbfA [Anaerolineaceae bacterium]